MQPAPVVTRFAPSPSGLLHLGHAYSAILASRMASDAGGRFLLRIEDIDGPRCTPEFEAAILDDLAWLGLRWETPIRRQSEHMPAYRAALDRLDEMGLIYPCFCTRKEIQAEIARMPQAPHGIEGPPYPGTCRRLSQAERNSRLADGRAHAIRLDVAAAISYVGVTPGFIERGGSGQSGQSGQSRITGQPELLGDIVLARRDIGTSYHLAVTVDDAAQGISCVTRGRDLFDATHIQRLLQCLLGFGEPTYLHHALVTDGDGKRLAKRNAAMSLQQLRETGIRPDEIWEMAVAAIG